MSEHRLYTVESIEGDTAHLVDETGNKVSASLHLLPRGAEGGIVIRVPVSADGKHDWVLSTADPVETTKRRTSQHTLRKPDLDEADVEEMGVDDVT